MDESYLYSGRICFPDNRLHCARHEHEQTGKQLRSLL